MLERLYGYRKKAQSENKPILRDKSFELLLETVKKHKPKKILEIGTNVGLSGIAMLLCVKDAYLTGIEIDEDIADLAKQNYKEFKVDNRARIILGDATEIIPMLSGTFDFIFIDGPKGHYYEYLINLLPLLSVGGIIFADDVYFHGFVLGKAPRRNSTIKRSMNLFLSAIQNDENLKTEIFDIEDGVSITQKIK